MLKIISFYINNKCNLNCNYCYHTSSMEGNEASEKVIDNFIREVPKNNFCQIAFFGGEPMLSPHIIEKVIKSLGNRFTYQIMTNGTIDVDPLIERLNNYKELMIFNVSYEGLNQKLRKANTDDIVKGNIEKIRKRGIKVSVISVLSQDAVENLIENMWYLSTINDTVKIKRMCSMATIWTEAEIAKFIAKVDQMVDVATFTTIERGVRWQLPNHIQYRREQNGIAHPGLSCQYFKDNWEVCGMDGKMYPCDLCYVHKINCLGDISSRGPNNLLDKSFRHHREDILYNVCSFANIQTNGNHLDNTGTMAWSLDEALDRARGKYQRRLNQLRRLQNANYG